MDVELEKFKNAYRDQTDFNFQMIARSRDTAIQRSWERLSGQAKLYRFSGRRTDHKPTYQRIKIRKSHRPFSTEGVGQVPSSKYPCFQPEQLLPKVARSVYSFAKNIKAAQPKSSRKSIQNPAGLCLLVERKNLSQPKSPKTMTKSSNSIIAKKRIIPHPKTPVIEDRPKQLMLFSRPSRELDKDTFYSFESLDFEGKAAPDKLTFPRE